MSDPLRENIKHNPYFVSSEDLPISGNDNLSCTVNSHFTLQFKKVFGTAIIHIYQICLHGKEKQFYGDWSFSKQNICFQKYRVSFTMYDTVIFLHFYKRDPVLIKTIAKDIHNIL